MCMQFPREPSSSLLVESKDGSIRNPCITNSLILRCLFKFQFTSKQSFRLNLYVCCVLYLLGSLNSSGLVLTQLHEGIIDLLHNFGSRVLAGFTTFVGNLLLDPEVCFAQTILDFDGGFPSQLFHDQLIVGVSSTDSHGSINVLNGQFLIFKGQGNIGEFNHVDHFSGSQVDGDSAVAKGQSQDSFDAVINEGKGASLLAIAPHFKVLGRGNGLTTEGSRSLFASSLKKKERQTGGQMMIDV